VPFIKFAMRRMTWAALPLLFPPHEHQSLSDVLGSTSEGEDFTRAEAVDADRAKSELVGGDFRLAARTTEIRALIEKHDKLKPLERDCLRLQFIEGLNREETAARLNRSLGNISTSTHRGIRKLAKALGADPRKVLRRRPNPLAYRRTCAAYSLAR